MKIKRKTILSAGALIIALVLISCLSVLVVSKKAPILKSGNFRITPDMISYLVKSNAESYVKYQNDLVGEDYKESLNISLDKSLRLQKSPYGKSWFNYFYEISLKQAKELLAVNEEAIKQNFIFSDTLYSSAKEEAESLSKEYKIGSANLEKIIVLQKKAEEYKNRFKDTLSEDVVNRYYKSNRKYFDCVDYNIITIKADFKDSNNYTDDEYNKILSVAKERSEELLNGIKEKGFDTAFQNFISKNQLSNDILESIVSERYSQTQFAEWAFDDDRKVGDTVIFPGKNQYSIYYLTKTMYPYDYILANALVYEKTNKSDDPLVLSNLRKKYKDYADTREGFLEFVTDCNFKEFGVSPHYKEDLKSVLSSWVYLDSRKNGDFDVCKIGDYVYAMWFDSFGGSYFSNKLRDECFENEYKNHISDLLKEYNFSQKSCLKVLVR